MDPLDVLILTQIAQISPFCEENKKLYHQWEPAYTEPLIACPWEYPKKDAHFVWEPDEFGTFDPQKGERGFWNDMSTFKDRLTRSNVRLPYNRCKHCHKRSNDLT